MQEIGIVAVLGGRHAIVEAVIEVAHQIKPGAPRLVRKRRVGTAVRYGLFASLRTAIQLPAAIMPAEARHSGKPPN